MSSTWIMCHGSCVTERRCMRPAACTVPTYLTKPPKAAEPETPCLVVAAVRKDLLDRSLLGVKKYGTTLSENAGEHVERLQHAYEEALDLANYLKWSILKLRGEL